MGEVEDLIKERNRLKAQREVRESMAERTREKKQLKSEISREKHAGLYRFGGMLGRASAKMSDAAIRYAQKKSAAAKKVRRSPKRTSRVPKQKPFNLSQALYG